MLQHKTTRRALLLGTALSPFPAWAHTSATDPSDNPAWPERLDRFAFGSCNFQWARQDYWRTIQQQDPQAWIWLGDSIYSDLLAPRIKAGQYNWLRGRRAYQDFRRQVPMTGTWDDHDFAHNDANGSQVSYRRRSQEIFLDFLDVVDTDERRQRAGIYHSQTVGTGSEQVAFVILDARFFKQKRDQNPSAKLLGDAQWTWLEQVFAELQAPLVFVGTSSQFLPVEQSKEAWEDFPRERERALGLFENYPGQVVLISGDRHYFEISRLGSIWEVTSSGLTYFRRQASENSLRVHSAIADRNFGVIQIKRDAAGWPIALAVQARHPVDGRILMDHHIPIKN